jgi:hypothetical protein
MSLWNNSFPCSTDERIAHGASLHLLILSNARRLAVSADLRGVDILSGAEALTIYKFNTGTAKHFFCSKCGNYTHHQRRSNPDQYGVNVACLAGLSPFDFEDVVVLDGIHHPKDTGATQARVVGHLKFIPQAGGRL